ncbi:ATP-binding protein [Streptomyces griseosporeus]|uniref:ATP-binding protein n=1 Tax=Streptomyces griseosporeus TaxID=1910 RepID=UPI00167CB270|nr:ATP-binding protein [Streptomyces griseosporeus]
MGDAREGGATSNTITGGSFFNAVVQGRDITVHLPPAITPALSGLPAPASAFTGRDKHVEQLLADLAPTIGGAGGEQRGVPVSAVSGLAGIGKTELAVQTAARALGQPGWFPGGVLFTDLAGYDPERHVPPERALEGLLRSLGIPGEHIPNGLENRQRLYRSVLAAYAREDRRILVVIDNASTSGQARPLLPTDGTTAAVVTSRHTLDGLDARLHDLDTLSEAASIAVLDQALRHARGNDDTRFADDIQATAVIARLCAGLPLALRIAAAILAAAPTRPAASLAAALQAEHTRLDKLARPDRAVRAAFELSYRHLTPDQARIFRLLPIDPGPDLSTEAATHLADTDTDRAEDLLRHLADAHLIVPGQVWGRWSLHDLMRLYADEVGHQHPHQRNAAEYRLHRHYVMKSRAARSRIIEKERSTPLREQASQCFSGISEAIWWFKEEHSNLIALITGAPVRSRAVTATVLAGFTAPYLRTGHHVEDLLAIAETLKTLSLERADTPARLGLSLLMVSYELDRAHYKLDAVNLLMDAVECFRECEDPAAEAVAIADIRHHLLGILRSGALSKTCALRLLRLIVTHTHCVDPEHREQNSTTSRTCWCRGCWKWRITEANKNIQRKGHNELLVHGLPGSLP